MLALLIRLPAINNVLYVDEGHYANIKAYFSSQYYVENSLKPMDKEKAESYFAEKFNTIDSIAHHPPLGMALFTASAALLGKHTYSFRIIPLIFGLISIILIYLIAGMIYSKKTAIYSAALYAAAFYPVLSSLQTDLHGSIQTALFLTAAYFFFKHEKTEQKKWFYLSAAAAGLALLNVITGLFIFVITGAYMLIQNKNIIKTGIEMAKYLAVSAAVFSIFPIMSFMLNKDIFLRTLLGFSMLSQNINPRIIVFLLIWAGPLLLGLAALGMKKLRKQDSYFVVWLLLVLVSSIFTYSNASVDRYLMLAIAPLCLFSGKALGRTGFSAKHAITGAGIFLLFLALLEYLNFFRTQYIGHDLTSYIAMAKQLSWNFYFPITGPTGPTFGIAFSSIALSLILSGIMFALAAFFLIKKQTNLFRYGFVAFIAISLAFNTILLQEYLVPSAHPNISKANYELIKYYEENSLPEKVYTNNRALYWYLGKNSKTLFSYTEESMERTQSIISQGNITVMLIDFPKIPRTGYIWQHLKEYSCTLKKTAYSNSKETGYVYEC